MQLVFIKSKRFIYVGLVLACGLFSCYFVWQQHVGSFLKKIRPPGEDEVRKWAGLSESGHLTIQTNDRDPLADPLGTYKWRWDYLDRTRSGTNYYVITVYGSDGFYPTNRAKFINTLEQQQKIKSATGPMDKESDGIQQALAIIALPNGQKSYGFILGLSPARVAFHPKFDVMVYLYADPYSYEGRPPADLPRWSTNSLYEFFTNVDAFLSSQ